MYFQLGHDNNFQTTSYTDQQTNMEKYCLFNKKKVVLFRTVRPSMINLELLWKATSKFWWHDPNLTMWPIKLWPEIVNNTLASEELASLQNWHPSLLSGQQHHCYGYSFAFWGFSFLLLFCYIWCSNNRWCTLMLCLCMHLILLYSINSKQYLC